ncbi:MAG: 2'-deoxycytidine 5'-triphosphate deaminase, partial [Nitrospirota bacterium]
MRPDLTDLFPELEKDLRLLHTTGLIPSQGIEELIKNGHVSSPPDWPIADEQIQPASIDLRLGPVAYRVRASFLPGEQATVRGRI